MNWNDYEAVWKRQPLPVGAESDVTKLQQTFASQSRKLATAIQVRDYAEAGAGVVVIAAYGFYWRKVGAAGWPMGLAIALILGIVIFFVRERFRVRSLRLGAEAPLLAKVEADIAELLHQCHLLEKLWCWYLGPCLGAIAIHLWVIVRQSEPWSPLREPAVIAGFSGFFLFVAAFAWWINHRALRKRFHPRLAELEKLQAELRGR